MINVPVDKDEYALSYYYVHGSRFRKELEMEELRKKNFVLNPLLYKPLPRDATIVRHTRNQNIKDQLFFD